MDEQGIKTTRVSDVIKRKLVGLFNCKGNKLKTKTLFAASKLRRRRVGPANSPPPTEPLLQTQDALDPTSLVDHLKVGQCQGSQAQPLSQSNSHDGDFPDDPDWIFDGEDDDDYTAGPTKLVQAHDGSKICVGLLPSAGFSKQLQSAVLEHRRVVEVEVTVDLALERTKQELHDVQRRRNDVEEELVQVQRDGEDSNLQNLTVLRDNASKLRCEQANKEGRQEELYRRIHDLHSRFREKQRDLFASLDKVFVESRLLPPASAESFDVARQDERFVGDHREDSGFEPVKRSSHAYLNPMSVDPPHMVPRTSPSPGEGLQRKTPNRGPKQNESIEKPVLSCAQLQNKNRKSTLVYECQAMRTLLHHAEREFDNRSEYFDQQADERDRKVMIGDEVETITEFDMRQITETQLRTRRLIEAEECYAAAKAALIGAGFQMPGSEASSGFADHPDDGYKLSFEEDIKSSIISARLQNWLACVAPAHGPASNAQMEASTAIYLPTSSEAEGVDIDEWDPKSVDICESSSMVAEGRQRKRIDRWRTECGLA